jgi:ferredoxin-type protein NapG
VSRTGRKKAAITAPASPAAAPKPTHATVAGTERRPRPRPEPPPPAGLESMSRRHWLFAAGGLAALAGGFWPRGASGRVRPPGALPPGDFERACIRCFRCAEVCPPKCIRFDSALDPRASDTPWLDVRDRACILCMKCTEVCPTGALQLIPADPEVVQARVKMGVPELDRDKCLPWTSRGVCRLCYYACPYLDEAIVLDGPRQAPVIRPEDCTGCGLCEEACPESVRAIRVVPNEGARRT